MANPVSAANAYAAVAKLTGDPTGTIARSVGQPQESQTNFASVLKEAIGAVTEMGQKSDAQARAAANGKANMIDVVTAVSETEVAIDAVVAVRDRVIAAYEEIMKMPI